MDDDDIFPKYTGLSPSSVFDTVAIAHSHPEFESVEWPTMGEADPETNELVAEDSHVEHKDRDSPNPDVVNFLDIQVCGDSDVESVEALNTELRDALEVEDLLLHVLSATRDTYRLEVRIPEMSIERRKEYSTVHSEIVESVISADDVQRDAVLYTVDFTDGRTERLTAESLVEYENGEAALLMFSQFAEMGDGHKRKYRPDEEWSSEAEHLGGESEVMELDNEDNEEKPKRRSTRQGRSHLSSHISLRDDEEEGEEEEELPSRKLRTRKPQPTLTSKSFKSSLADQDQDELTQDPGLQLEDDEDFLPVISDLALKKGRANKVSKRSRRSQTQKSRSQAHARATRRVSDDSDIEFEQPRRSARSTRNKGNMQDDDFMDEDSFYVVDDKTPAVPKIISIKEIFQVISAESPFGSAHMELCHTCNGSRQRGQLVHCQGCSLSFHKSCIGYRSAREHMVTKIGVEEFVLQCRFCIGLYKKRDENAPNHSMCQVCKQDGKACVAFSEKKTSRQEEKLREQNGGVDPITQVSPNLLNNPDIVLFRCTTCHRGWHHDHLPSIGNQAIGTDLKTDRLKDYSIDWQCNDCSSAKQKIHRLVAWRPANAVDTPQARLVKLADLDEDGRDYLIKWENTSYAHCAWMNGAWVHGVTSGAMRNAFGRRVLELDLLKFTEKEAIPDEFLMADVILNVKMDNTASRLRTKAELLANVSKISKIYVKFQGLGYDDVVWDSPPPQTNEDIYSAFLDAYHEYVDGQHFKTEPFSKIRDRIKTFKNAKFVELEAQPQGLKRGKLMGYQVEGLNWLLQNYHEGRSVVLADEMGLGKTVQVVSLVTWLVQAGPKCWPFLIVVPNSTCPNWRREFKQWAPDIRVVTYHGGKEPQELAYKYELFPNGSLEMKAQVVIMSYDSAQDPRTPSLFKSVHWTGLVVDEGQRLKNDQNLLYQALKSMKIPFRLLLTGTPLQNNKRELFNLLQFIDETQNAEKLDQEFEVLDKHNLPILHEKIRPYFLRRTKTGVLKFLPPMSQIILPVTMSVLQETLSKRIMAKNPQLIQAMFANSKINSKERGSLNNILMQLRKCLCHPFVYSAAIEERHHDPTVLHRNLVEASAKLLLLEIMLPKLKEQGHRVLIFSQFLQQLDIVEDFLSGMGYDFRRLDGQISSLEKQRRIDAFNAPESPIFAFLLSTRAGGVGINLATADTVIIMDPDFNPHQDMQALSRAHRIGQKNKVLCFQLVTKDSVEERIMQAGRKKMALDHALIESMDDDEIAGDDLESILKHGAQALFDDDYQKTAIVYDSASVDKLLDRSQIEKPAESEDAPAETHFSHTRVWANDKLGFEDLEDLAEDRAPEPINSSVWDQILAQREQEAQREAEANREVLGRGARRRTTIDYKNGAAGLAILDGVDPESSDSSDDFAGVDSGDDSDDGDHGEAGNKEVQNEIGPTSKTDDSTKREKSLPVQQATKVEPPVKRERGRPRTKPIGTPNSNKAKTPTGSKAPQSQAAESGKAIPHKVSSGFSNSVPNGSAVKGPPQPARNPQQHTEHDNRHQQGLKAHVVQGEGPSFSDPQQSFLNYIASLNTEAQLRLAIDRLQRAPNPAAVQQPLAMLIQKLQHITGQYRSQQR